MRALFSGCIVGRAGTKGVPALLWALGLLGASLGADLRAQAIAPDAQFVQSTRRYRCLEGSAYVEDCETCAAPTLELPIEGVMWVRPGGECLQCNTILALEVRLATRDVAPHAFAAKGQGTLRLLADSSAGADLGVVALERLVLRLDVERAGAPPERVLFDSGVVPAAESPPWIDHVVRETTEGPVASPLERSIRIVAVPWPSIHFSTASSFTSDTLKARVSEGDFIAAEGGAIIRNAELTARLGISPGGLPADQDLGLDAAVLLWDLGGTAAPLPVPQPVILFSTREAAKSESLGPLSPGDLLSSEGGVALAASDWLTAFSPMPPAPDPGLDAAALDSDGNLIFSVETDFFSERLGRRILPGDLLVVTGTPAEGRVWRAEADLLSRFGPITEIRGESVGVDALFVWPHGEVWFSSERSFRSATVGTVLAGDILSDRGRVVLRNHELLRPWAPLEEMADFGIDALAIDAERQWSDCGFLAESADCVLFEADCGGTYYIPSREGFAPGERVRVTGILANACRTTCPQGNGCILGATIEPCGFDGCGRLVQGPESCVFFRSDLGSDFLLDELGGFQVGDRVQVTGKVSVGCNSACVTPCRAIVGNTIGPCLLETCGRLVEVSPGCVVFETAAGDRYLVENLDGFSAGESVFVRGEFADECETPCGLVADAVGCIANNEVEAAGPIGEVGFFRRADCNADGEDDLSDAVFNLLFLFSAGSAPVCPESCDSNADSQVDISDSVFILTYLFMSGSAPPPPYPGCGEAWKQVECDGKLCPCLYPEVHCEEP